ncbi:hypothetical protein Back11_19750 [Paenibacillus baekrokdamisoli]|uniref:Uncharacterized protein n=1 Tax=Paenibacillus baekrokdamisoli TaxID=1712516 RepID=A0A3G9IP39_9BACL|nr:hypothetical protein [Paenibacillus baekrokdamisoli]MBB3070021.1 hypothetical protein [Paenibacillus baekrokdamisoli]BBH20630.1 hypothetical protein Back11_19750 [Paenibacillus baekrokdamisoli]
MKKKGLVLLSVSVVLLVIICLRVVERDGFAITVENNTEQSISGLVIAYPSQTLVLAPIPKQSDVSKHIQTRNDFAEGEINLVYKDKSGLEHKETIFGYIEKGYHGSATLKINGINNKGELAIAVKAEVN